MMQLPAASSSSASHLIASHFCFAVLCSARDTLHCTAALFYSADLAIVQCRAQRTRRVVRSSRVESSFESSTSVLECTEQSRAEQLSHARVSRSRIPSESPRVASRRTAAHCISRRLVVASGSSPLLDCLNGGFERARGRPPGRPLRAPRALIDPTSRLAFVTIDASRVESRRNTRSVPFCSVPFHSIRTSSALIP